MKHILIDLTNAESPARADTAIAALRKAGTIKPDMAVNVADGKDRIVHREYDPAIKPDTCRVSYGRVGYASEVPGLARLAEAVHTGIVQPAES